MTIDQHLIHILRLSFLAFLKVYVAGMGDISNHSKCDCRKLVQTFNSIKEETHFELNAFNI
jgi:hypothetical protein